MPAGEGIHRINSNRRRRRLDLANIAHILGTAYFRNRNSMLLFRNIDSDVNDAIIPHGPSSFA
jgi:hypothetical protein